MVPSEKHLLDNVILKQKRDEIHILCDLLFEEFKKPPHENGEQKYSRTIETAVLVRAFEELFHPCLTMVSGYSFVIVPAKKISEAVSLRTVPHSWLKYDDNRLIDVVPVDGRFGISVPQAVLQNSRGMRFFPNTSLYPTSWKYHDIQLFNVKVTQLAEILFMLQEKVPT